MTFGAPLVFGSRRIARRLFAFNSRGWLSAVPRKFAPAVVPALPASDQPAAALEAFVQTRLLPLYARTCPAPGPPGVLSWEAETVPAASPLAVAAVAAFGAKSA